MGRRALAGMAVWVLLVWSGVSWAAPAPSSEVRLTADQLRFDPATERIEATGNVRLLKGGADLRALKGQGFLEGKTFRLQGKVQGVFPREGLSVDSDELLLSTEGSRQILEATGNVRLHRGKDQLSAGFLRWTLGGKAYLARQGVHASFTAYRLEAEEVGRDGDVLWAKGVRRYEDPSQGIVLSASGVRGRLAGEQVAELEATGSLEGTFRGAKGEPVRLRGEKGIYSKERGTVVVSGNARAIQADRTVTADSLVLHLDTRRLEALGNPQLVFTLPKEGKP